MEGVLITRRTIKYLLSMLHHVPVISVEWVKEIARVIDGILQAKRQALHLDCVTDTVAVSLFPPTDRFWIQGDVQTRHRVLEVPVVHAPVVTVFLRDHRFDVREPSSLPPHRERRWRHWCVLVAV